MVFFVYLRTSGKKGNFTVCCYGNLAKPLEPPVAYFRATRYKVYRDSCFLYWPTTVKNRRSIKLEAEVVICYNTSN